jgi:hypothetical protein
MATDHQHASTCLRQLLQEHDLQTLAQRLDAKPAAPPRRIPGGALADAATCRHNIEHLINTVKVPRNPLEERHNTEVDYPALRRLLAGGKT